MTQGTGENEAKKAMKKTQVSAKALAEVEVALDVLAKPFEETKYSDDRRPAYLCIIRNGKRCPEGLELLVEHFSTHLFELRPSVAAELCTMLDNRHADFALSLADLRHENAMSFDSIEDAQASALVAIILRRTFAPDEVASTIWALKNKFGALPRCFYNASRMESPELQSDQDRVKRYARVADQRYGHFAAALARATSA